MKIKKMDSSALTVTDSELGNVFLVVETLRRLTNALDQLSLETTRYENAQT